MSNIRMGLTFLGLEEAFDDATSGGGHYKFKVLETGLLIVIMLVCSLSSNYMKYFKEMDEEEEELGDAAIYSRGELAVRWQAQHAMAAEDDSSEEEEEDTKKKKKKSSKDGEKVKKSSSSKPAQQSGSVKKEMMQKAMAKKERAFPKNYMKVIVVSPFLWPKRSRLVFLLVLPRNGKCRMRDRRRTILTLTTLASSINERVELALLFCSTDL
jgi:hypothetical protein